MPENKYEPQKEYLKNKRKQLRVWVGKEKYERFAAKAEQNGVSVYALINKFMDDYLAGA